MVDCMLRTQCVQVLVDVSLPAFAAAAGQASSSTVITAGTWLDAGDPLVDTLPRGAYHDGCSPSPIGAVAYFCIFVILCSLILVNFVIG